MTPSTPAGGAVAFRYLHPLAHKTPFAWTRWLGIEDLHHYGADGSLVQGPHPDWRKVEYAYTQPPATVPVEDVLALVANERVIELAQRLVAAGPKAAHVSASECHEISDFILSLRDELESLVNRGNEGATVSSATRGEK